MFDMFDSYDKRAAEAQDACEEALKGMGKSQPGSGTMFMLCAGIRAAYWCAERIARAIESTKP